MLVLAILRVFSNRIEFEKRFLRSVLNLMEAQQDQQHIIGKQDIELQ